MDSNNLRSCLEGLVSQDLNVSNQSRSILLEANSNDGFLYQLLMIINSNEIEENIKLTASITFNDFLTRRMRAKPPAISRQELENIKENIAMAFLNTSTVIRSQMESALDILLKYEYPDNWNGIRDTTYSFLTSNDQNYIFAGLIIFRKICRANEYSTKRNYVNDVISQFFPLLRELLRYLVTTEDKDPIKLDMMLLILKSIWSSMQFFIPTYMESNEILEDFIVMFIKIFENNMPYNEDVNDNHVLFMLKKSVVNLNLRFLNLYKNNKQSHTEELLKSLYLEKYAIKFLECCFNDLSIAMEKKIYLPKRLLTVILNYVSVGISYSTLWREIKPNLDALLDKVILPLLSFNEEDWNTFTTDLHEWLRPYDEFYTPRTPALNILSETVKYRGTDFLVSIMNKIESIMNQYKEDPSNQDIANLKFAAFEIIGTLNSYILKHPVISQSIENLIVNHVYCEFYSDFPYLKSKACWILGKLSSTVFKSSQNFIDGLNFLLECMKDKFLPISVEAAISLGYFMNKNLSKIVIGPILPDLLKSYLQLINEIDNEYLTSALQSLIENYGSDIDEHAIELMRYLSDYLLKLLTTQDSEDDDILHTELNTLSTITTLLDNVNKEDINVYETIEEILLPLIEKIIMTEMSEFVDSFSQILTEITYYSPYISERMWKIYNLLVNSFMTWADDTMSDLLPIFENIASQGSDDFLKEDRLILAFKMYEKLIGDLDATERDCSCVCQLAEVIFLNYRGKIDDAIPHFLQLAIYRIPHCYSTALRVFLFEVILNAMYYNVELTLQFLSNINWYSNVFDEMFKLILDDKFSRVHDKRCIIFGLSTIFQIPFDNLPEYFKASIKDILMLLTQTVLKCSEQKELESNNDDEHSNKENTGEESEDEFIPDNQDVSRSNGFNFQPLKYLMGTNGEFDLNNFKTGELPTDNIEESVYFIKSIECFSENNVDISNKLFSSLSQGEKNLFNRVLTLSKSKENQER